MMINPGAQATKIPPFISVTPKGKLRYNLHKGQLEAWEAEERIVAIISGTQGGKTSFGPLWFYREIQARGPGDYLIVTPTFPLLEIKLLPEFKRLFERYLGLGKYKGSPIRVFTFDANGQQKTFGSSGPDLDTNIYFGYATDYEALESATVKGAWLDEAGQKKFKLSAYEAVKRRLALNQGRLLITTTPYYLGWLKTEVADKAKPGSGIKVVRFESIQNPMYPLEEYEEARASLPRWKFDLFYRAIWAKPAGLIYDSFDEDIHKISPFAIPPDWPRYFGLDFGGTNLACIKFANEPGTDKYYLYQEYLEGGKTVEAHTRAILKNEPGLPLLTVGGSQSEDNWRREFRASGLPVKAPDIKEVEVGIDRVWGMHKSNRIFVFDTCLRYLDEKASYSRPLDDNGEPTEGIEDKNDYHLLDAERYIIGFVNRKGTKMQSARVDWRRAPSRDIVEVAAYKTEDEISKELDNYEQSINI